jgi:hypothetical protein
VVTGVTFIEVGSVMVLTTSQTTATRMFAMFAHSSMAVGDVASKFSCVAQSGRHCTAGGVDVVVTPEVAGEIEGKIVAVTHTSCQLARARGQATPLLWARSSNLGVTTAGMSRHQFSAQAPSFFNHLTSALRISYGGNCVLKSDKSEDSGGGDFREFVLGFCAACNSQLEGDCIH